VRRWCTGTVYDRLMEPLEVEGEPARGVMAISVKLNGTVNPGGQEPAEYYFEYGTAPCNVATGTSGTKIR